MARLLRGRAQGAATVVIMKRDGEGRRPGRDDPEVERIASEVEEEIRLHLEARIEELVGEGLDPERARVVAMERFGDVERTRAVCVEADRRWMMRTRRRSRIDGVAVDLRMAGRALAARPWFTVSAVATLVLGIGASTAIVSAADHILFRPLPYVDADRVVTLWRSDPRTGEKTHPAGHGRLPSVGAQRALLLGGGARGADGRGPERGRRDRVGFGVGRDGGILPRARGRSAAGARLPAGGCRARGGPRGDRERRLLEAPPRGGPGRRGIDDRSGRRRSDGDRGAAGGGSLALHEGHLDTEGALPERGKHLRAWLHVRGGAARARRGALSGAVGDGFARRRDRGGVPRQLAAGRRSRRAA